ncbi:MAG: polar amino acid transport system substrate-binding protein [Bermanella sp.]|jgi:polar amino acid transport system substrate-binding protein|uniref:substrate-binding periplasmic protein n=1 Tax=Glaciecola sp. 33A TaxID=2057807 RepID=UPI001E396BB4|nr:ABC transporter substrate-binding protein [Glaciecola sp. 33A]
MSQKIKMIRKSALLLISIGLLASASIQAQTVNLVGNKVATYIDEHKELAARQMDLVTAALSEDWQADIVATTQAWSGSGLRSGKFVGYIDHYSLNDREDKYIYSKPYMQVHLHAVSRYQRAENIVRLEQLYRERVGIENRFANTDQLRGERDVLWARTPSFFDNIEQLAEDRVDFLLIDKAMADEMNLLLKSVGETPIYVSKVPLIQVNISLAMNRNYKDAKAIITDFDKGIERLKASGKYLELLKQDLARESLLDARIYADMLVRW